jgi:hypothetical protein
MTVEMRLAPLASRSRRARRPLIEAVWSDVETQPISFMRAPCGLAARGGRKDEAKEFIRAYERLKLEMDRLKKHEDELDFFAREMQCRHAVLGAGWGPADLALRDFLGLRPQLLAAARRTFLSGFDWHAGVLALRTAVALVAISNATVEILRPPEYSIVRQHLPAWPDKTAPPRGLAMRLCPGRFPGWTDPLILACARLREIPCRNAIAVLS